eukprot:gene17628-5_t
MTEKKSIICYDVITEPPTRLEISLAQIERSNGLEAMRQNTKSNFTICMMHSFGKCRGKNGRNPQTCQQIHVERGSLASLRSSYIIPFRKNLARTVKACLSVQTKIDLGLNNQSKMQYLEFRWANTFNTKGRDDYNRTYETYLRSASSVFMPSVEMCLDFSVGRCNRDNSCNKIHAYVEEAMTKDTDRHECMIRALRELRKRTGCNPMTPRSSTMSTTSALTPESMTDSETARSLSSEDELYSFTRHTSHPSQAPPSPTSPLVSYSSENVSITNNESNPRISPEVKSISPNVPATANDPKQSYVPPHQRNQPQWRQTSYPSKINADAFRKDTNPRKPIPQRKEGAYMPSKCASAAIPSKEISSTPPKDISPTPSRRLYERSGDKAIISKSTEKRLRLVLPDSLTPPGCNKQSLFSSVSETADIPTSNIISDTPAANVETTLSSTLSNLPCATVQQMENSKGRLSENENTSKRLFERCSQKVAPNSAPTTDESTSMQEHSDSMLYFPMQQMQQMQQLNYNAPMFVPQSSKPTEMIMEMSTDMNKELTNQNFIQINPTAMNMRNKAPMNQSLMNQSLMNQSLMNQSPMDQSLMNQSPGNKSLMNQSPMDQSFMNQSLLHRAPINQTPMNQTPLMNQAPMLWSNQTPQKQPMTTHTLPDSRPPTPVDLKHVSSMFKTDTNPAFPIDKAPAEVAFMDRYGPSSVFNV